ncbi:hypothetical protein AQUCO_02000418v1 [Aquilegia coerulea]|uniref:RING-type E3 ubiquitin transferase n=1 Tax=Aquilegia coerulea TaxID=218851 RepID=A0A2G5DHF3_AQUCA|nr:hypothetical protein AQUCO_02000418v1 [Aquilegia coerulea]
MANEVTAVAIDKDKHSQAAVRWAVDNLLSSNPYIILIHVRVRNQSPNNSTTSPDTNRDKFEAEIKQLFLPYRGFCSRKGVRIKEVVLDDMDIGEAIVSYVDHNYINNIVVGASTRGFLQSWRLKNVDVPTCLLKSSPDFCSVYVIAKGKIMNLKTATRAPPYNAVQVRRPPSPLGRPAQLASDSSAPEDAMKTSHGPNSTSESSTSSLYTPRTSHGPNSNSESSNFSGSYGFRSGDTSHPTTSREFSNSSNGNSSASVIDAEMRRLRMELKQTMEMYNSACKEANSAKEKSLEVQQWKKDEARKVENARHAEEAALSLAKLEKAKAHAALEAAEKSKRLALLEAKRRRDFEMKSQTESEARSKVVNALEKNDIRYRKYDYEDIKIATGNFSESLKIGEGGYGPVYRATLDHTPVAVKVLRSDAAQGMKQFQQEVEVLSCIRHPNMVLLLGACPESGCLVYEYMENGSLEDRLFRRGGTPPIPWWIRFKIAAEIATGLLFLHQTKPEPLVHRDLKPANILLDRYYVSKISDVGLARLVPPSVADNVTQYHMTSAAGTFCYIDPEYQQTGMLGTKSDVYSLGVMLLQVITGRPPMGLTHHVERSIERGTFQDLVDPSVPNWPMEEAISFAKMALRCAELRRKDRPDLGSEILPELNRLRALGYSESNNIRNFNSSPNSYTSNSHLRSSHANQIQDH